ncbi:hypothetical protein [Actinoallomurus soli]|uniref:hypothetical protein n=1 Tax=Actinoallomurus soli TaxID=2952535 RepID=UPI00209307F9|nr:hypothetical protein [Actinoallomurus soli]MCO5972772.1 hypothetical protein [Actinoallomurus soli]
MLTSRILARLAVIGGIAAASALPLVMTADASTKVTRHVTVRISTQDQTIKLYQRTSGGGWTFTSRLYRCGTHPRQTLFACYLDR